MNSELLKTISKCLTKLKKERSEIAKELKTLNGNKDYLSRKGKVRLSELNDRLYEVEEELKSVQENYNSYDELCKKLEELKQLIDSETKPETKKVLENLHKEKLEVLNETEKELSAYYTEPKEEKPKEPVSKVSNDKDKLDDKDKENKDAKEESNNKSKKRSHKLRNIILVCGGISLVFTIAGLFKSCIADHTRTYGNSQAGEYQQYEGNSDDDLDLTYDDTEDVLDLSDDEVDDVLVEDKILQVSDVDAVVARAEEILGDLDSLDEINHSFEGNELNTIVNIIRVSNGELPLDEDNNEYYNPNVVDKYVQARTDIFANYQSSTQLDKIYDVNYADIVTDDVNLQKFAEEYDDVYNKIAEARNNGDWDSFAVSTKTLGEMLYSDWVLQGMYDGNNPYNFEPDQRLLALGISTERYGSYVMEYENSNRGTICADVCIDYNTGNTKEIPVEDIYNAIVLGICNDATLAVNAPSGYQIISEEFYKNLVNELDYKNQLSLKLN